MKLLHTHVQFAYAHMKFIIDVAQWSQAISLVWMELAMFGVAAVVYVAFLGEKNNGGRDTKKVWLLGEAVVVVCHIFRTVQDISWCFVFSHYNDPGMAGEF